MARSQRSSVTKANNVKLKQNVFGPTEIARTARLSEKLLELARQPKPSRNEDEESSTKTAEDERARSGVTNEASAKNAMDVDATTKNESAKSKGRIEKRKVSKRKASIAFPRFKDGPKNPKGRRVFRNQ